MELFSSFASPSAACQDRAHSCVQVTVDASVCHCWSLDRALVDSNCSSGVMILQRQRVYTPESAGQEIHQVCWQERLLGEGLDCNTGHTGKAGVTCVGTGRMCDEKGWAGSGGIAQLP